MQWHGLKIPVVILSLLAGLAVIFAAQWLYQKYSFQEPLNVVLSGNKAVESFQVNTDGNVAKVNVSFKSDADLMDSYKKTRQDLSRVFGRRPFQLILSDNRDEILTQVWYNSQYAVYQAIAQGSYQDMASTVNRESAKAGAEARIYLDQENIYLRLRHQGHTLDQVIPRGAVQNPVSTKAPATGGEANAQGN